MKNRIQTILKMLSENNDTLLKDIDNALVKKYGKDIYKGYHLVTGTDSDKFRKEDDYITLRLDESLFKIGGIKAEPINQDLRDIADSIPNDSHSYPNDEEIISDISKYSIRGSRPFWTLLLNKLK